MQPHPTYRTLNWVDRNVAIGGYLAASDPKMMAPFDVIVSMIDAKETPRLPKVEYKIVPTQDVPSFDMTAAAADAAIFVRRRAAEGKKVFVHCHAGISRSATVVLIYMMSEGARLPAALKYLKSRRPQVQPNVGFMRSLQTIDAQLQLARLQPKKTH